jgi:sulfonate transport system ATP-binding protein
MTHGTRLDIHDLHKSFGTNVVLQGIDLVGEPGEFIAIVGKSGCGKSTLLRLIAGLDTPDQGRLHVDGEPVQGLNRMARMMFQDARLLPWKRVLENVGLGLRLDWRSRAEHALEHVGLRDRAGDWPALLSGGQRQRVALARALVSEPRLLLLDEPLGSLDALTRIEMQGLIERLWQEQEFTAILITHDVEEAVVLADRVLLIESGEVTLNMPVTLPRPRQRGSAAFAAITAEVLDRVLGVEPRPAEPESPTREMAQVSPAPRGHRQAPFPVALPAPPPRRPRRPPRPMPSE